MERGRHTSVLRFGTYEVDPDSGELRKAGIRIKVQQQPLKVLEILLKHPGEVVTREELRAHIWPQESYGDFDQAVTIAVAKLRGALSDSADNPRFVETIPRRGYRFIAEVAVLQRDSRKPESAQETPATTGSRNSATDVPEQAMSRRLPGPLSWKVIGLAAVVLAIYAPAHHWYGMYLVFVGRKQQGLAEAQKCTFVGHHRSTGDHSQSADLGQIRD